jgi:phospholipid/cholesterol/gamma-HCH transport system substrate-binding protein
MNHSRRAEFAVGFFVLAGLAILGVLIVFFSTALLAGRGRYTVFAEFPSVRGMAPGTPVRHLGIDVGELRKTRFSESRDKVRLELRIYRDHSIPANAKLTIRPSGLLGDYYLEFYGGNMESGSLPQDGTALVIGETSATFEEIAGKIGDFTKKLEGVLDNLQSNLSSFTGRVNRFLDNETMQGNLHLILEGLGQTLGDRKFQEDVRAFAAGLRRTVGDEKFQADLAATVAEAPATVKSFREVGDHLIEMAKHADELVEKLKGLSDKLDAQVGRQGENMDQVAAALRKNLEAANETMKSLNEILARVNDGKGTVGALLTSDDLHRKLIKTVDELNDALIEIGKMADGIRRKWGN